MSPCCGPSSPAREPLPELPFDVPERDPREVRQRMVAIPGGRFAMGGEDEDGVPGDGEGPVRTVHVDPFHLDPTCVTNRQFAAFVKATGYRTDAERIGWSFVFGPFLPSDARQHVLDATVPDAPWWAAVRGATWKAPEGPGTDITHRQNHPVVHVSHVDANAYARWAGKRLPTEAEWERAARGGLEQCRYPWGDELTPKGRHRCNIWQGTFPSRNTGEDGHLGTAPANSFAPNGYGLYNMSGNVWEWCADWWSTGWHATDIPETRHNPAGPSTGDAKVIRGGSHLCHLSYCNRYRVAARTQNTPDSSTGHMGFRCAADAWGPGSRGLSA